MASLTQSLELPRADVAGAAHGFPALRTWNGEPLASGEFTQFVEDEQLHIRIRYDFGAQHVVEEQVVLQQMPELRQRSWSWIESRGGAIERRFEIDFDSGKASATKREGDKLAQWDEQLDIESGRAFAGSAFTVALTSLRSRLLAGETIELQTIGFTPQPKLATVAISHASVDLVAMSGREIRGDRFVIHPQLPWIAKLFVDVPDTSLWLVAEPPAAFLRWEGPLAEPSDPIVRVDLLPGVPSGPATPTSAN